MFDKSNSGAVITANPSSTSSKPINDSTEKEFEDILNQLNALGDTIDQELSNKSYSTGGAGKLDSSSSSSSLLSSNSQQKSIGSGGSNYSQLSSSTTTTQSPNKPMAPAQSNNNYQQQQQQQQQHPVPPTTVMAMSANYHYHHSSSSPSSSPYHHQANDNHNVVVGQLDGIQHQQYYHPPTAPPTQPSSNTMSVTNNNNNKSQITTNPSNAADINNHHHLHHSYHHHHHHIYPHDSITPPTVLNDNTNVEHHESIIGFQPTSTTTTTTTTNGTTLRTDSPDNDSAFSDSISLISSEQSSSSSTNNNGGKCRINKGNSGQSSQSVNSSGSNSSCEDNIIINQSSSSSSASSASNPAITGPANTSTGSTTSIIDGVHHNDTGIVVIDHHHHHLNKIGDNSIPPQQQQQQQQQQAQQQLFFEQNEKQKDDDSNPKLDDQLNDNEDDHSNRTLTRNNKYSNSILSNEDNLKFELITNLINDIDWQLEGLSLFQNNDNDNINTERDLVNKIRINTDDNHYNNRVVVDEDDICGSDGDDDGDCGGKDRVDFNEDHHYHLRLLQNHHHSKQQRQQQQNNNDDDDPKPRLLLGHNHENDDNVRVVVDDDHHRQKLVDNNKQDLFDEKIRMAMEKIREANIRKLYLKVFAEDDSSKCLMADERMTVGQICQQMAQKNHIALGMNYCIMEHMPQLYLERFYEDHESLVENVLYWGRDHSNKLYFVQQPDKYDLFIQPEKYLISFSQPNENIDTLKSGSLRAKYNAQKLRKDLIEQFFQQQPKTLSTNNGQIRIPEIEGNLYLRSEGKKVWKKYFFSLRSSGLYYCPKGKPKSTKDLICLTTFELNCVYYGFGWKKKFKAPNDFGFAIKHPQIQMKSPKHIKYLCAETMDDLKLWLTGIRIAKYGKQLLDNYEQFRLSTNSDDEESDSINSNTTNKKIITFPLNDSTNDLQNVYGESSTAQQNLNRSGSIMMRSNRIPRNDSVRSSSASSSSGCLSEQSSVVSTPSSGSSTSNGGGVGVNGDPSNYHQPYHHLHHPHNGIMASPHHHQMLPNGQPNAFEADFPIGTIKRKPNVMIQPKIPLTNTTRNLALQADDPLLEVTSDGSTGSLGEEDSYGMNNMMMMANGAPQPTSDQSFQRGTFKNGTLRRTPNDVKSKMLAAMLSPQHNSVGVQQQNNQIINHHHNNHLDDDLPPPPPPPPANLKEAESTLSLNASFPPPPPPEVLDSSSAAATSSQSPSLPPPISTQPPNSLSISSIPSNSSRQSTDSQASSPCSPMKQLPPSMAALPLPPMTPQPQIKNRLTRRLSDLSENATYFMNFRSNYDGAYPSAQHQANQQQPPQGIYAPHSRASYASSSDSTSFVTLKSNFLNGHRRFQRNNSVDYYHHHSTAVQQQQQSAWNKYGTSPRLRPFDQNGGVVPNDSNYHHLQQQFYQRQNSTGSNIQNYAAFSPVGSPGINGNSNVNGNNGSSHCALVSDLSPPSLGPRTEYDIPPTRVKVFANYQQQQQSQQLGQSVPPQFVPPPPPPPSKSHYGSYPNSPAHHSNPQQQPRENHYMSISPHLLQKHQQMMQQQQQQQHQLNQIPYHVPEDLFLKNMERVMQKKWHVAQMLQQDTTQTPGQVLGFRDSAYLPPPPPPQSQPDNYPGAPPQPSPHHTYNSGGNQFNIQSPTHYPSAVPIIESQSPPYHQQHHQSSPYHHNNHQHPTPPLPPPPPMTPTHHPQQQQPSNNSHYGTGNRKIPPPPPKRSDSTQLTSTNTANINTSRRN